MSNVVPGEQSLTSIKCFHGSCHVTLSLSLCVSGQVSPARLGHDQQIPAPVPVALPAHGPAPGGPSGSTHGVAGTAVPVRSTWSHCGSQPAAWPVWRSFCRAPGQLSAKQLEEPAHLGWLRARERRSPARLSLAARQGTFHLTRVCSPSALKGPTLLLPPSLPSRREGQCVPRGMQM